jgi:hypothetical protein
LLSKKNVRIAIDITMTVIMPVMMSYQMAGEALHEYLGIALLVLFILHNLFNYRWFKNIPKGRYTAVRILNSIVNLLLLVIMILLSVSGIMMSRYILPFQGIRFGYGFARVIHLLTAYWGFLLMSLHIGLHWNAVRGMIGKKRSGQAGWMRRVLPHAAAAAVSVYGIYAFCRRGFINYLFLRYHFVFFDYPESLPHFLVDYFAIMAMAACAGYYLMLLVRRLSGTGKGTA